MRGKLRLVAVSSRGSFFDLMQNQFELEKIGVEFMAHIHDFIECLNDIVDERFPNTTRYIIRGGDFIEDVVMELREENRRFRYSPYELFNKSNNY